MQKLVFINGAGNEIDLTSGNFGITNWAGLSNADLNIQTQQVPFQDGSVFLDALIEPREIELTLAIFDGNNLELRYQKKRELISALNPKLGEGTLIYTNDYLSRQIKAVPQIPLFENKNSNDAGTLKASVAFTCPNPYWEDLEETVVELLPNTNKIINYMGDIKTGLNINIIGNGSDFKIKNFTENKGIEYHGSFATGININTNTGRKSVESLSTYKFNYSNGGTFSCITKRDGYLYAFSNVGIRIYNEDKLVLNTEGGLKDITCSAEMFLGITTGSKLIRSYNGINWEIINVSTNGTTIQYSEEERIFILNSPWGREQTTNGNTLTTYSGTTEAKDKLKIRVGELYVRANSNLIQTSLDDTNWTTVYTTEGTINEIIYKDEEYIITGQYGQILTSKNLVNWENKNSTIYMSDIHTLTSAFGKLWCGGIGKWHLAYSEDNGKSWTRFVYENETFTDGVYSMLLINNRLIVPLGSSSSSFAPRKAYLIINEDLTYEIKSYGTYEQMQVGLASPKIHNCDGVIVINDGGWILTSTNFGQSFTVYEALEQGDVSQGEESTYAQNFKDVICVNNVWWGASAFTKNDYSDALYIYKCTDLSGYWSLVQKIDLGQSYTVEYFSFDYKDNVIIGGGSYGILLKIYENTVTLLNSDISNSNVITKVMYYSGCFYCIGSLYDNQTGETYMYLINKNDTTNKQKIDISIDEYEGHLYNAIVFHNAIIFIGGDILIENAYTRANTINNITQDSNMDLSLEVGTNDIVIITSEDLKTYLSYRQKYIGV